MFTANTALENCRVNSYAQSRLFPQTVTPNGVETDFLPFPILLTKPNEMDFFAQKYFSYDDGVVQAAH